MEGSIWRLRPCASIWFRITSYRMHSRATPAVTCFNGTRTFGIHGPRSKRPVLFLSDVPKLARRWRYYVLAWLSSMAEGCERVRASIHTHLTTFDDEEWRIITLVVNHLDSHLKYTDLFAASCAESSSVLLLGPLYTRSPISALIELGTEWRPRVRSHSIVSADISLILFAWIAGHCPLLQWNVHQRRSSCQKHGMASQNFPEWRTIRDSSIWVQDYWSARLPANHDWGIQLKTCR